jgi:hypothetical protein
MPFMGSPPKPVSNAGPFKNAPHRKKFPAGTLFRRKFGIKTPAPGLVVAGRGRQLSAD